MLHGLERDGLLRRTSDAVCSAAEDAVERWGRGADVVVAPSPLAGQTLGRLREQGRLAATPVTYLTDPPPTRPGATPPSLSTSPSPAPPHGLSFTEALVSGLPAITYLPTPGTDARTPPCSSPPGW